MRLVTFQDAAGKRIGLERDGTLIDLAQLAGGDTALEFHDMLALIAAVLSVSDIPLGITLGVYTLVELLPIKTTSMYGRSSHAA